MLLCLMSNPLYLSKSDFNVPMPMIVLLSPFQFLPQSSRVFQAFPPEQLRHTEILTIDNNSPDNTAEGIEKLKG